MKREKILVSVREVTESGAVVKKNTADYSHTVCVCDCITQRSDCDEKNRNYNPHTSTCNTCKENRSSCDPTKQTWNSHSCSVNATTHCSATPLQTTCGTKPRVAAIASNMSKIAACARTRCSMRARVNAIVRPLYPRVTRANPF